MDQCKRDWIRNPIRRKCVWLSDSNLTTTAALEYCAGQGGTLVILDSEESMRWFTNLMRYAPGKTLR